MSQTKTASDAKLRSIMETALQELIDATQMFTAFDVTTKIRNEQSANGIHVFHSVVKEFVHDEYENGIAFVSAGYNRTLVPLGVPQPWLYYIPGTHDPETYQSVSSVQSTPPPTVAPAKTAKVTKTRAPAVATFGGITGGPN